MQTNPLSKQPSPKATTYRRLIITFHTICVALLASMNTYANSPQSETATEQPRYDAELTTFPYPFPVQEFHFESQRQKLTMRYMDVKPTSGKQTKSAAKTAVLLHGKNFSGYYWESVATLLSENGYRVIIPDQIGFGKSTKPTHYQYSFAQLALNTRKLLEQLHIEQYTLVGHSMGGMLATVLTQQSEHAKAPTVGKLILINPIGLEPYLDFVEMKDPDFFYQNELKKNAQAIRNYQRKNYYDGRWSPAYEALIQPHLGWLNGKDHELIAWNNALTYGPIFAEDITRRFPYITTPTALIIGTRDTTGPGRNWKKPGVDRKLGEYKKLGKQAAQSFPNATLFELEGLGHMPQIENFARFKPTFLQSLE